eukprot:12404708-Karenia_brevis.AAC.1
MHDEQNKHTFIDGQNQQDLVHFSTITLLEEIRARHGDGADDAADVIKMVIVMMMTTVMPRIERLQVGRPKIDHRSGDHRLGDLRLGDHRWGDH